MTQKHSSDHLEALGSNKTKYNFDTPDRALLEKFDNPNNTKDQLHLANFNIHIEMPEFTSLCPKTGQPDFANIVIDYEPRKWCVESKSLKLYLMSFRNHGEFHEACVITILNDLIMLLKPKKIKVRGEFTPRGGIPFWPEAQWPK